MHTNIHFGLHVTNFCSIMSILLFPESYNPNQSMHMIIYQYKDDTEKNIFECFTLLSALLQLRKG
jgi:hypothetical protein